MGCSDEEAEERREVRINYNILDTYDYDRVKVVVEDEMSAEDLARETLRSKVGLTSGGTITYPETGILEGQGVFVETAIADGSVIPTRSGFSRGDIDRINRADDNSWEEQLEQSFSVLEDGRKQALSSLNEGIDRESDLAAEITRAAEEQRERIAEQERLREEQQSEEDLLNSLEDDFDDDF